MARQKGQPHKEASSRVFSGAAPRAGHRRVWAAVLACVVLCALAFAAVQCVLGVHQLYDDIRTERAARVSAMGSIAQPEPPSASALATDASLRRAGIAFAALLISTLCACALAVLLLRRREDAYRQAARAAQARNDFFTKMCHGIRTPLNTIIGLQTLTKDSRDINAIQAYLAESCVATGYILDIVNDVLDMSRVESGGMSVDYQPFDIRTLIADTAAPFQGVAVDRGLDFRCYVSDELTERYIGDAVRIRQALSNLLDNAVQYSKPSGQIMLAVTCRALDATRDEIVMAVRDTGVGMSREFMSRVFRPFEQERASYAARYAGSGLGLFITHSLVTLMGGTIEVDSKLNEGTAFTVTLPLTHAAPNAPLPPENAETARFSGRRVLLVEDNAINRDITTAVLQTKFGIVVESAPDGEMAVRLFTAAPERHYDLILMDVEMPNMNGLDASRQIRALDRPDARAVPIIALTANAFSEDIARSFEAGMNDHLVKPLDLATLARVLSGYLLGDHQITSAG